MPGRPASGGRAGGKVRDSRTSSIHKDVFPNGSIIFSSKAEGLPVDNTESKETKALAIDLLGDPGEESGEFDKRNSIITQEEHYRTGDAARGEMAERLALGESAEALQN